MEGILTSLYAGNYATKNVDNFYLDSMALQVKLEAWRKDLPSYFDLATYQNISPPPLPHYLSLLYAFTLSKLNQGHSDNIFSLDLCTMSW